MFRIFIALLFLFGSINAGIKEDAEKAVKSFFGSGHKFVMIKYDIAPNIKTKLEVKHRQKFFRDYLYIWKIYREDSLHAFAVMDNVYGKSLPITFLVIFDSKTKVINAEIIKYRESYGGAVKEKSWLKQFIGKDHSSSFELGEDINSISGATISADAVTRGIAKLTELIKIIQADL
ncbi:FMN-binding protein [Melioribacter sp. OK-6-Me]|uniref:FMN-binding protein n=1 Tax=unclassified Melioribacter TaxID=2627329 RepID=UPI003ED8CD7C